MLVQNPPSIPSLAVANVVCYLRNTILVLDWHNFGYSLLALKLGAQHPFVAAYRYFETRMGRHAPSHICVSQAMARMLKGTHKIDARCLYDRPVRDIQPLGTDQRSKFLNSTSETAPYAKDILRGSWRLVVSSTSWTADEDFSILLDALSGYSAKAVDKTALPKILVVITGKGPLKDHYLRKIRQMNQRKQLQNVIISTAWLSTSGYASLLGSADLGISLHTSSSGVDLPMKVVDMFGAGLPVAGWSKFEAWPELVKEGQNGKGFGSAIELQKLLLELFHPGSQTLRKLKKGALKECERRWDDEWDAVAGKHVFGLGPQAQRNIEDLASNPTR